MTPTKKEADMVLEVDSHIALGKPFWKERDGAPTDQALARESLSARLRIQGMGGDCM